MPSASSLDDAEPDVGIVRTTFDVICIYVNVGVYYGKGIDLLKAGYSVS